MNLFLDMIASSKRIKAMIPKKIKQIGRMYLPFEEYMKRYWLALDEFRNVEEVSTYKPKYDLTFGIIKELTRYHKYYIGACIEMGVRYKIIDITCPDWIDILIESGCDAFLVRPSALSTELKQMYDEKLKIMVDELGLIIYPPYKDVWIYESKRKMHYWLKANNIEHPKTWVFYDKLQALDFCSRVDLPIVYKSNLGTTACGVIIFQRRDDLIRHVKKCFDKGYVIHGGDPRDRQWGSILLQEYLLNTLEWRMVCIDGSYFGHQKLKEGDFHSGSKKIGWFSPPDRLLNFVRHIMEKGNFSSMCLDVFETTDGRYLVNELQALFGQSTDFQMLVNGKPGRYIYNKISESWEFDEGDFCRNSCCNLRLLALIEKLKNG